jgi:phage terminase large subunit-like protein
LSFAPDAPVILRNPTRADKIIAFLNRLPLVDGIAVGQRFSVDPWLAAWIRAIYEPEYDDGQRVVRKAVLSVARKNAKSYAVAGLLLCHLIGPESVQNGQVFSCAVDRSQARVIFDMCAKMIRMEPQLQHWLQITDSKNTIFVKRTDTKARGSKYRALSADSATKHGLGPTFFVYDEFGEARDDDLWNTMYDGQQAVASPLAVVISTQNHDPEHPLSKLIDDGLSGQSDQIVCHLYAADEGCALDDREQWLKANPALATWKSWKPIEEAAAEAIRMPAKESNFRRRYLNQRISLTASLISRADWKACEASYELADGEPIYLALDMSKKVDLTALVAVTCGAHDQTRTKSWFWKPRDEVEDHVRRDRVRYDLYASKNQLNLSAGRVVSPRDVAAKIVELCGKYDVRALVFDRWGTDELLRIFDDMGFASHRDGDKDEAGLKIVAWGQGFKDMTPAIEAFEREILTGALKHDGHPLLTANVMNAQVESDKADGRKFNKIASRFRIDGAVALAMGLGFKARNRPKADAYNPFEDPDFDLLKWAS